MFFYPLICRPKVHMKINTTSSTKVSKSRILFTLEEAIRDGALKSASGDSLTGNGLNRHPTNACLTATQQLPASRDKISDSASTLPLDVNVDNKRFFCSHSHIKNHLLTRYSPQIDSDLWLKCEMCCVLCYFFKHQKFNCEKQTSDKLIIFFPSLVFLLLDRRRAINFPKGSHEKLSVWINWTKIMFLTHWVVPSWPQICSVLILSLYKMLLVITIR